MAVFSGNGTAGAPSFTFSSDTDTGIYRSAANEVAIALGGAEHFRVTNPSANTTEVLIGGPFASRGGSIQVETNTSIPCTVDLTRNSGANGASMNFLRTRGSTFGANDAVLSGDRLGQITFSGGDGTGQQQGATILSKTTGNFSPSSAPTRLEIYTCPSGSTTDLLSAVFDSNQYVYIGYSASNGSYPLQVNGQIFATSGTIATSDARFKTNVETLTGCFDLVKNIRPVSFDWIPQEDITYTDEEGKEQVLRSGHRFPAERQVGFIAQEVEQVLTGTGWGDSVVKESLMAAAVTPGGEELAPAQEFKGIAEGNMIAILTSALKEAIARIEALEAAIGG